MAKRGVASLDPADGKILATQSRSSYQCIQTVKTDTWSISSAGSWQTVTGMSVTITPTSASSRIHLTCKSSWGTRIPAIHLRITRSIGGGAATAVAYIGDAAGSRPRAMSTAFANDGDVEKIENCCDIYVDSPATTSAVVYQLEAYSSYAGTAYLNRMVRDNDGADYDPRWASVMIATEV